MIIFAYHEEKSSACNKMEHLQKIILLVPPAPTHSLEPGKP
jgi:hypothetical protein